MSNIVEVVAADRNLAVLARGLQVVGLEELLSKEGPFTVFAPSDLAFGKLQEGQWPDLMKAENKVRLTEMMNNYVVRGKINFKNFTDGQQLSTLGSRKLAVKVTNGDVAIEGARIQRKDMEASNGVVHSLDSVVSLN